VYSSVAEAACKVATNVIDDLFLAEVDIPAVEDIDFVEVVAVYDRVETVLVGSSASDDGSGGVVVTGHTEQVCTEWHYEVVE
jgi:hypothetical protein